MKEKCWSETFHFYIATVLEFNFLFFAISFCIAAADFDAVFAVNWLQTVCPLVLIGLSFVLQQNAKLCCHLKPSPCKT